MLRGRDQNTWLLPQWTPPMSKTQNDILHLRYVVVYWMCWLLFQRSTNIPDYIYRGPKPVCYCWAGTKAWPSCSSAWQRLVTTGIIIESDFISMGIAFWHNVISCILWLQNIFIVARVFPDYMTWTRPSFFLSVLMVRKNSCSQLCSISRPTRCYWQWMIMA